MKIVNFTDGQGSEEWLTWRRGGLGASDISIITGSNPYSTPLQLWEKKCGYREEETMSAAMRHGVENEARARQWCNENWQLNLKPLCIEECDNPYFRASLDGYDFDQETLVEIKCPVSESVLDKARVMQFIPDYWFDQLQWQIMLCAPKRAILALWDYRVKGCISLEMFAMPKRIKEMREKAQEFWRSVQMGRPPKAKGGDYVVVDDPQLRVLLEEYAELTQRGKSIKNRQDEVKEQIIPYAQEHNVTAFGYKVYKVAPKVSYDLEQMKMDGVDIEKYQKKTGKPSFRIVGKK